MFRPMRTLSTQDLVGNSPYPAEAPGPDFRHIEGWIFDLDNTLYPPGSEILRVAEGRIRQFIGDRFGLEPDAAHRLQKACLHEHGSTLAGMIRRFGVEPEPYLAYVNDLDVTTLPPAPALRTALERLPGKRLVFTNNCGRFAERVLAQLGIADLFDAICDIRVIGFAAKPARSGYETVLARTGIPATKSAMFEDAERNLAPAHALGMTTVWYSPQANAPLPPHVHHSTHDLTQFLHSIEVKPAP
jgi:putative hydrolase of the HAD superfamily